MDKHKEVTQVVANVKVAYALGNNEKVERLLLTSLEQFSLEPRLLYWLSQFYMQNREFSKVITLLEYVELSDELLVIYIHSLRALKRHEQAIDKLLVLTKLSSRMELLLATLYKELGKITEACTLLDSLICGSEHAIDAAWQKSQMITGLTKAQITRLENDVVIESLSSDMKATWAYTLASTYDAKGNYKLAFDYYQLGALTKLETFNNYAPKEDLIEFKKIIAAFNQGTLASKVAEQTSAPIFIVGMPRTGTTLVEQIIASHSQVTGADELSDLAMATHYVLKQVKPEHTYPDWADELAQQDYQAIAQKYLSLTKSFQSTYYFTDKMPLNFKALGIIFRAFPDAKVIHCQRSGLDTIWGNFRQLFGAGIHFSYDLTHLAHYYQGYKLLMEHWFKIYPDKILTVDYETLVGDQQAVTEQILDYLDLPAEDSCFEFYKSNRVVHTLSNQQVRQPIFKSGLNRWENYEFALNEVKDILSKG